MQTASRLMLSAVSSFAPNDYFAFCSSIRRKQGRKVTRNSWVMIGFMTDSDEVTLESTASTSSLLTIKPTILHTGSLARGQHSWQSKLYLEPTSHIPDLYQLRTSILLIGFSDVHPCLLECTLLKARKLGSLRA
jgi:hypothetical protein